MAISSFNVNSLLRHIDEIRLLINDLGIHILAVNETKIDDKIDNDLVSIEGYSIKRSDRNRNGGGVALYVKDASFDKAFIVESGVYETTISDHYLVYCVKRFRDTAKKQHKNVSTRQMKNFNEENFLNDLQQIDWKSIVSNTDDINLIVEQWTNMFSLILEKHAPLRCRRVSEKFCPWLTKDFKCLSATRDRLKLAAVRSKSKIIMDAYKQMRNRVNRLNKDLKRDYFTNKIALSQGDLKNTWKTINMVLNKKSKTTQIQSLDVDGKHVTDNNAVAQTMNDFFCDIGKSLSDKIPQKANPLIEDKLEVNPENLQFKLQAFDVPLIKKVFGKFKTSKGFGPDGIANHFLKIAFPVIAESLCDIFNLSIATGVFPENWKTARVNPIFKSGEKNNRSNYRPISVLPFLARLFEKLIYNQLYDYLDKNKLLYSGQSGYRALHSTVTCLLSGTNDWHINIERGKFTGNIFIDLKKAFDTVDHAILIQKLSKYGIQGLELQWFKSYLSSRQQFTKVNGVESDIGSINCGVPQGSCLGPLLFLIYINDLPFALKNCKVTMYADDTSISYSSKSIEDLTETLNNELKCLKEWLQGNKLSLNVTKTQAMVIGSRPNLKKIGENTVGSPAFVIDDSPVELVDSIKYLGVQVDQYLVWDEQIKSVQAKVSRSLGFLKYAKKFLPKTVLCKLYRGIVEPHFRYCCSVWGSCAEFRLVKLQKLQNRAARIITNSSYDAPAEALITELKWPTVRDMIRSETATTVYKSVNSLAPDYLSHLFVRNSERNCINLRNAETDLLVPFMKTSNGQKAFAFRGAKIWNDLSREAKQAPSLSSFKNRIKGFL